MLERSDQAPASWTGEHAQAAIREFALRVRPDVIHFQELPRMVPYVETHAMVPSNPATHSGNLATLVTHRLVKAGQPEPRTVDRTALLTVLRPLDLTLANVHLIPGPGAAEQRYQQMARVKAATDTAHLLVLGDTNSRLVEAERFTQLGLRGEKPPEPTWDSRGNRFNKDMPEFSAYFTRYFVSAGLSVDDVTVWSGAAVEHDGSRFQLSDHFALSGRIRWAPSHGR